MEPDRLRSQMSCAGRADGLAVRQLKSADDKIVRATT
jgi:hypothetical protein